MRPLTKVILILFVILVELAWVTRARISLHGPVLEEPFRHDERFATLVAKSQRPSAEAEAAFNREVDLLNTHMARREHATVALILALNGAGIYWFWRYAGGKSMA
jgi:hypothetical protein